MAAGCQRGPVDAARWLTEHAEMRTPEGQFACRKGCGFCCTYPPKVSEDELAAIEAEVGSPRTAKDPNGNERLTLQGGCGGCVLLEDRECTAHQHRPDHCEMFPFHVYFGRDVEVIADRVCPGIDVGDATTGPHQPAREAQPWEPLRDVDEAALDQLASAEDDELAERAARVQAMHEAVARQARWDDAWTEPEEAIDRHRDETEVTARAWTNALEPFGVAHDAQLPTAVIPTEDGFQWRAWRIRDGELTRLMFTESGRMEPVGTHPAPSQPDELGPVVEAVLDELVDLEVFVGTCMHLVEEGLSVDEAVERRLADVAAGLSLHARLVEAEGLDVSRGWLRAVYEPEFFTLPTLGEWL